ncbi:molecular chaperone HscB [Candidatus Kinetoplastibacterium blastocrithidii (ex Strigomonas culicis)]|nr:molecular chaperone HscB [Candidatus Kinetoplastibacterium blastocrithidii (ex Strigomonas culicis)]
MPILFSIDQDDLEKKWRNLSCIIHPDRYVDSDDIDRKASIEMASFLNKAYKILKDPILRASYICEINGIDFEKKFNASSVVFLEQQLIWRESIDSFSSSKNLDGLKKLEIVLCKERDERLETLSVLLDHSSDYINASVLINDLKFIDKIFNDVTEKILFLCD